ncbi:MAG: hypothetical protein QOH96_1107, partial [Blastocatellia bacterium]|nr:hypothetical protein [Blastocatellia bacterium]
MWRKFFGGLAKLLRTTERRFRAFISLFVDEGIVFVMAEKLFEIRYNGETFGG